jgi:hypothetical protein
MADTDPVPSDSAPDPTNPPTDFPFAEGVRAARFSVALHAGGSTASHLDFFLGSATIADRNARTVRTWRVPCAALARTAPDAPLVPGAYAAEEIAPHRAAYLALPQRIELSEGRGSVEPLLATVCHADVGARVVRIATEQYRITLNARGGAHWLCEIESIASHPNQDPTRKVHAL